MFLNTIFALILKLYSDDNIRATTVAIIMLFGTSYLFNNSKNMLNSITSITNELMAEIIYFPNNLYMLNESLIGLNLLV